MTLSFDPLSAETLRALTYTDLSDDDLAVHGIEREAVCRLSCPTGAIVAFDPAMIFDDPWPAFARRLPPGDYPVFVYILQREDWGPRIGLAELRVAERAAMRWELAWTEMPSPAWRNRDPRCCYNVDSGKGCFIDAATRAAIFRDAKDNPAAELHPLLEDIIWFDGADELRPDFDPRLNLAIFSSGFGDGSYTSYWGTDAVGAPVRLVTSFDVLEEAMRPPRPPQETP